MLAETLTPAPKFILREYQEEAQNAVKSSVASGVRRPLVSLSTGLGKTVLMASLPEALGLCDFNNVTLIVAHRDELIKQTHATVRSMTPNIIVDIEKAAQYANPMARVVVGSIQTLQGKRLQDFLQRFRGRIALFMIDEAHHAATQSYLDLAKALTADRPNLITIGVTATPQRSDNKALTGCFDDVVFHHDLKWSIDNGYLVPIHSYRVKTSTSLDSVETREGDYIARDLARVVDNDQRNHVSVAAYLNHTKGKKAIAFTPSVDHAEHLAETFRLAGVRAAAASIRTEPSERLRLIEEFRHGGLDVLVNFGLYTEGFDLPDVEVVINARPTKSSTLYVQIIGRALRPVDEVAHLLGPGTTAADRVRAIEQSRKPHAIILDIVDQASKLSIVTIPTIFGMPAAVDPEGEDLRNVKRRYDAYVMANPAGAYRAASQGELGFVHMETELERVNEFTPPENPPEFANIALLTWYRISGDVYRLPLPPRRVGYDVNGTRIPQFEDRFRALVREAKRIGQLRAEDYALDRLNVDRSRMRYVDEAMEIRPNDLGQFECWQIVDDQEMYRGKSQILHEAIRRAEHGVKKARKDVVWMLSLNRKGGDDPVSEFQLQKLRSLGVPLDKAPNKKSEASRLIDKMRMIRRERGKASKPSPKARPLR